MKMSTYVLILIVCLGFVGCGVKGDPIPPQKPPELGRGEPTYRRATEEFAFPDMPAIHEDQPEDKERK